MTKLRPHLLITLLFLSIAGCSGDSSDDSDVETGYITNLELHGLEYETETQSGEVDEQGRFRYREGENIRFFIGDWVLTQGRTDDSGGVETDSVPAKRYMTPIDFIQDQLDLIEAGEIKRGVMSHEELENNASVSPLVVNPIRLLTRLSDSEGNSELSDANIYLSEDIKDAIAKYRTLGEVELAEFNAANPDDIAEREDLRYPWPDFSEDTATFGAEEVGDDLPHPVTTLATFVCEELELAACRDDNDLEIYPVKFSGDQIAAAADEITKQISASIFLSPDTYVMPANSTEVVDVKIVMLRNPRPILELDVNTLDELPDDEGNFPTNPRSVVNVEYALASEKRFGFSSVGEPDQIAFIKAVFKLEGDYRWLNETLKVTLK